MRKIRRTWLYIAFFSPLAFFYEPIKSLLGGGWHFALAAIAYLLVCSVLAYLIGEPDK